MGKENEQKKLISKRSVYSKIVWVDSILFVGQ